MANCVSICIFVCLSVCLSDPPTTADPSHPLAPWKKCSEVRKNLHSQKFPTWTLQLRFFFDDTGSMHVALQQAWLGLYRILPSPSFLILCVMPCLHDGNCTCLAVLLPITILHAHHLAVRVYFINIKKKNEKWKNKLKCLELTWIDLGRINWS